MTGSNKIPATGYPTRYPLRFEIKHSLLKNLPIDIHTWFTPLDIKNADYYGNCI